MNTDRITRPILGAFGRIQRPMCWIILVLSLIAFVAIGSRIWTVPNPLDTGLVLLVLVQQAIAMLMEVENEVEDGGEAEA